MLLKFLFEEELTADKLKSMARTMGEKLYGDSHTGFMYSDKINVFKISEIESESEYVDTFDFVFFPSTGKSIDAADKYKLTDEKLRDVDGFLYLAGADGVKIIYFGKTKPKIKIPKSSSVRMSEDEWKKKVLEKQPNVEFVRKIGRTDAMIDGKVAGFWFDDVKLPAEFYNPPKKMW